MSQIFIFLGPTLSSKDASTELDASYLPPAAQGDVYRVALRRPSAIGIVDGYFERVPSVWHKEILWALDQGIHVFGAGSMGALRAAELTAFGMEGVGSIYASFRDGVLEDDDEVAVAHGGPETGYVRCSEAMVNIRVTLEHAQRSGIINVLSCRVLTRIGKVLFYPDRSYEEIIRRGYESGVAEIELERLHAWLPSGSVNQKRLDALAMLRVIRQHPDIGVEPKSVSFHFERTGWWEKLRTTAGGLDTAGVSHARGPAVDLLDDV